ncbi:MAG: glycogen-binding domain-containing protein [Bacteroidia bacterium]
MKISGFYLKPLRFILLALCIGIFFQSSGQTGNKLPDYHFEDGQIVIRFDKNMIYDLQDSLFTKFGIEEPGILKAMKNGDFSTFVEAGWVVKDRGKKGYELRRSLEPLVDFNDPKSRMALSSMFISSDHPGIPVMQGKIGVNDLKTEYPKHWRDSLCIFRLEGFSSASEIILSGSFNQWSTHDLKLKRKDDGWETTVKLPVGKHLYKYIVDGKWVSDKNNNLEEQDGYGERNSVYYMTNHEFRFNPGVDYKKVFLSGSFVDWNPKSIRMIHDKFGSYKLPVYLVDGTYSYKFVADSKWYSDDLNPNKVEDGNAGFNSVISLGNPYLFKLIDYPNAESVFLAGDFNDWNPTELALSRNGSKWELPYVLAPGNYQYKFVVDNEWISDPSAELNVDDGVGNKNSLLIIQPNSTFNLTGYPNAKEVYLTGSFNDWSENSFKMKGNGSKWTFQLYLDPGKYTYKFIVDGNWIRDPENELWEENESGTGNSLIWVEK